MAPNAAFARLEGKKDPWPQSCWIMNSRTRKQAAGTLSSRPHHHPWRAANAARSQIAARGTAVTRSS